MGAELDAAIWTAIEVFEKERAEAFSGSPESQRYLRLIQAVVESLVAGAEDLTPPNADDPFLFEWKLARRLFQTKDLWEDIEEGVQIALAWKMSIPTGEMVDRAFQLCDEVLTQRPTESVLRFMRRVARTYILGFNSECIIMCRAVLENVVRQLYDRQGVSPPPEMRKRLEQALREGWISTEGERSAWTVWKRGNTAVHNDPEVTKDVFGTIRLTMKVVREIYPEQN